MAKNVGWEAKSNHDGSYTVTVNGKQYYCADTHEFLHFLEDIGERWEDSEIRKGLTARVFDRRCKGQRDRQGRYDIPPVGSAPAAV